MKRVSNNIKFYTFIEILKSYSDENVSLSIKEIQHHMRKRLGVDVDRRTIYAYIRDMKALGIDVSDYDKSKEGYYINSNCFEASEVRLLADAVLTSNFVTRRRTEAILEKLRTFNSIYQNKDFLKDVYIEDIPKSTNEDIFVSMARISEAIKFSRKIRFNYCEYNYFRELECKVDENGNLREFVKSPVYMVLRDKNYYLVCEDEDSEVFQYFRIDMMLNVFVIEDERIMDLSELGDCRSADCKNTSDFSQFTSRNVSIDNNVNIFPRRTNIVMVEFKKNLMESLLDEFGDYICVPVRIGGMYGYAFDPNGTTKKADMSDGIYDFLKDFENTSSYKIMMSHRPDSFIFGEASKAWDIDLVVSSHDHGGQVVFPFLGGFYGGDQGYFPEYIHGLYNKDKMKILISSGLGSNKQKLPRFNNVPEVMVVNLSK